MVSPAIEIIGLGGLIACGLSWIGARVIIWSAGRFTPLDVPNERSSHERPTPRGGGIGLVCGVTVATLLTVSMDSGLQALLVTSFLVAAVGWWDDYQPLSAKLRLVAYLFCAAIFWMAATKDSGLDMSIVVGLGVVAVFFVAWLANLTNFMDGIDGLAASHVAAAAVSSALLLALSSSGSVLIANNLILCFLILAFANLGFLFLNWSPARVFMGDVGSVYLGFLYAGLSVLAALRSEGSELFVFAATTLLFSTFLVDATWTLAVRFLTGQKISQAHRSHCYQVLVHRYGFSHAKVALCYLATTLLWLLPLALLLLQRVLSAFIIVPIALLPLISICVKVKAGRPNSSSKTC